MTRRPDAAHIQIRPNKAATAPAYLTLGSRARVGQALRAVALGVLFTGLLAACGAPAATGTATPAPALGGGAGAPTGAAPSATRQRTPAVSGLIAAVDGHVLQVQSTTKQTAVTVTATTALTRIAAGKLADVTVGSCVVVRAASAGGTTAGAPSDGPVDAAGIQVTQPTNGTCLGGFGGGFRGGDGTGPNPAGMPSGQAPGGAGGNPAGPGAQGGSSAAPGPGGTAGPGGNGIPGGMGAAGQVTAVSSEGFTVAAVVRPGSDGAATTAATVPIKVITSAATTVSVTVPATAVDLAVGRCATALGTTDETGAMAATSIVVREAVDGVCVGAGAGAGQRSSAGASHG